MKQRKTLWDIFAHPKEKTDGNLPHIFHRYGKPRRYPNEQHVLDLQEQEIFELESSELTRLMAYGVFAAGDKKVPYLKGGPDPSLQHALRMAIGMKVLEEAKVFDEGIPPIRSNINPGDISTYRMALEAVRHGTTAQAKDVLSKVKDYVRGQKLKTAARMLKAMVEDGIDCAMREDMEALREWYQAFHTLYGTEANPNPSAGDGDGNEGEPFGEPVEMDTNVEREGGEPPENYTDTMKGEWGEMLGPEKVPMIPWKHPTIKTKKRWKYSEFGVFKYPWRALPSSDYLCFSLPRRNLYGGTILIDFSGSMHIDQNEVDTILDMAPYATIACYASLHGKRNDGERMGKLFILAADSQKGKASYAKERLGGGNVVDGPALRWLAKQSQPRIWVSDGGVTGVAECQTANIKHDVDVITRSAKIIRVPNLLTLIQKINAAHAS